MGFTKLDEGIVQSSIMAEDPITFKVWITLLAMCKENGIAYVSPVFLSSVCHLTIDDVSNAIRILCDPDPNSRSLADDGRRIRRVDLGYEIINYQTYRGMSLRSANAEKQRLYREKKKAEAQNVATPSNANNAVTNRSDTSASASLSSFSFSFLRWWEQYPRKIGKIDAERAYSQAIRAGATEDELLLALKNYCIDLAGKGTEENFIKHPATFLRAERWRDFLVAKERPKQIGENDGPVKGLQYWAEVRRLKDLGIEGDELTNLMSEWEAQND